MNFNSSSHSVSALAVGVNEAMLWGRRWLVLVLSARVVSSLSLCFSLQNKKFFVYIVWLVGKELLNRKIYCYLDFYTP